LEIWCNSRKANRAERARDLYKKYLACRQSIYIPNSIPHLSIFTLLISIEKPKPTLILLTKSLKMVASNVLKSTALAFLNSLALMPNTTTEDPVRFDMQAIRAVRAPNYSHTFGHNFFVSQSPPLQGTSDLDGFMERVAKMTTKLESETKEVLSVAVDSAERSVVARVAYQMKAPGQKAVENDLVWWLWMDAKGTKVEKSVEFVDPAATKELQNRMNASSSAASK
jgi:hypothetical protein